MVLCCLAAGAKAQTTQPAAGDDEPLDGWGKLVERFALESFKPSSDDVKAMVAKNVVLGSFDGSRIRSVAQAMRQVADGKLVMVRAYEAVPTSLAKDLAKAVKESPVVPDEKKASFDPGEDSALSHANDTAAEWVRRSLSVDDSTALVGVIMVWHPRATGDSKDSAGPVFMLLDGRKGEGQEPEFLITRVVVGSPTKN